MTIVKGGHAIMLSVTMPEEITTMAKSWVDEDPEHRHLPEIDHHVTLLFVGRDLADYVGKAMLDVVNSYKQWPKFLTTSGPIKMFGGKKDHVAVLLQTSLALSSTRAAIKSGIEKETVADISASFGGYNPHVTIGSGRPNDVAPASSLRRYDLMISEVVVKIGNSLVKTPLR